MGPSLNLEASLSKIMSRKSRNKPVIFKIAIIGEGPTEWHYFTDMRQNEKFGFEIKPGLPQHSDFKSIIKTAIQKRDEGYDLVFCVFDMDRIHANTTEYRGFLSEKSKKLKNKKIVFIESMPCIEIWFLLHFINDCSFKAYQNYASLKPFLIKWLVGYEKTEKYLSKIRLYTYLKEHGSLPQALELASRLNETRGKSKEKDINYTQMNELITGIFMRAVNKNK